MMSIEEQEKIMKKKYQEERAIKCPYCGNVQENDDLQYPVTCWGEPSITEFECQDCEKVFFVEENVRRKYNTGKTAKELF